MKRKVALNIMEIRPIVQDHLIWQPPPKDCLKLNVDASIFNNKSSFSLGMVLRDDHEQ